MNQLDCIVIGYNDVSFNSLADKHRPFQTYSGTYGELKTNSVLLNGQRKTYMELLNHTIMEIHGCDPNLNAFEVPNLGAVYLTSFLRSRNFAIELINFYNFEKDHLASMLMESPRAVAITTTYYIEDEPIKEIIEFVRQRAPKTKIILGGPFVHSMCADNRPATQNILFKSIGADFYIVDAQGEATLAQILDCLRTGSRVGRIHAPECGQIPPAYVEWVQHLVHTVPSSERFLRRPNYEFCRNREKDVDQGIERFRGELS